jgi:hypothetical protein
MDGTGKLVYNNRYAVEGSLNTVIVFDRVLAPGIYIVEFLSGEKMIVDRFIVQN